MKSNQSMLNKQSKLKNVNKRLLNKQYNNKLKNQLMQLNKLKKKKENWCHQ